MAGKSVKAQLVIASQRVRLFGDIIGWILADLFRNAKRLSFFIIGFSVASVFTRLSTIGLLMIFVKAKTEDTPILFQGIEIPSDTSLGTLAMWGGTVLLLAVATGLLAYLAEAFTFKMAQLAMLRTSNLAVDVIAAGQSHPISLWSGGGMKMISRKAMMGDSMMLMRSILVLGGVAVPLMTLCVFGAMLFYINVKLTLYLIPALVIYAIPFYMLNRSIAKASRNYELKRLGRSQAFRKILDFASQTQYPGILRPAWADHFKADPGANEAINSFRGIILTKRKLAMLQDILYGSILCVILVAFGSFFAAASTVEWIPLLWYLVILRYVMTGMNGTASLVIALNRFAPQIKRLKQFITYKIPDSNAQTASKMDKPLCIQAIEPKLSGSMDSAFPKAGDIIACIGANNIDSYYVREFCNRLISNSKQSKHLSQEIVFCGDVRNFPQLRICELITGQIEQSADSLAQVEESLKQMGVLSEVQHLPKGMDTILTESVVNSMSSVCRYAICLAGALCSSRKYMVLDWKPLVRIPEAQRQEIFNALSDRVVVLVSINGQGPLASKASLVVVMDDTAVRGIGDLNWFSKIKESGAGKEKIDSMFVNVLDDDELDDDI